MDARWTCLLMALLAMPLGGGCDRGPGSEDGATAGQVEVNPDLGSLRVVNRTTEPITIHLDGQELYAVQPGSESTFRNLPTRKVDIYGVGRITQKHYGLPQLTIAEKGDYEWTINP